MHYLNFHKTILPKNTYETFTNIMMNQNPKDSQINYKKLILCNLQPVTKHNTIKN